MSVAASTNLEGIRRNTSSASDVEEVRRDFPILGEKVRGKPLVYLDNAATTQKPRVVIEALDRYRTESASIHRGIHLLSERATRAYEEARATVARFLGAADASEIVFVRGTTEAINLVAQSYGRKFIGEGDEIVLSAMEHHSNIVPWQILREQVGAGLRVIPMNDHGELLLRPSWCGVSWPTTTCPQERRCGWTSRTRAALGFDPEPARPEDHLFESEGIRIVASRESPPHLDGLRLAVRRKFGGVELSFENPRATRSCGCGHTFSDEEVNTEDREARTNR